MTGLTLASGNIGQGTLWVLGGIQARRPKAKAENEAWGEAKETNLSQGEAEASAQRKQRSTLSDSQLSVNLEET